MPYIELRHIAKRFGPVAANRDVSLSVEQGEIHALLGENGSGKSTLVNMLSGLYTPDEGEIFIGGRRLRFSSPKDAIAAGVGMVHQHFKLVEVLTARENIVAGTKTGLLLRSKKLSADILRVGERFGLTVDPNRKIYRMSVGEKQTVEILKVLYRGATVLILDEPTAVLTPQETQTLFSILRNMRRQGCAIILITHKLGEVLEISDRVTVLRRGESVGTVNTRETNARQLTELMVGHPIRLKIDRAEADRSDQPLLVVDGLTCTDPQTRIKTLRDLRFSLFGGEILGVAGVAGSGQKELCEIIAGLQKASGGSVLFKGEQMLGLSPRAITARGISMSFIPEDRLGMGLVAGMDIVGNMLLKSYRDSKGPFVDRAAGRQIAREVIERFDISTPSVNHIVRKLSGGNIQKVLLGREVRSNPSLLITAYPVRGLDIGASYRIYDILNQQKKAGVGVLFIGEDLDVLLSLSDRLLVLHAGESMGIVDAASVTKEEVGLMMLGHRPGQKEDHESA
jgi:ABC-type uncharacterized transport system ATPase subunit